MATHYEKISTLLDGNAAATGNAAESTVAAPMLRLFAVFHLNLAFSSLEESDRSRVIESCYWALLTLAGRHGPLGIEATGYTLEEIYKRDPAWIQALRDLRATGKAELIGSGYSQLIGPLVPAKVVAANLSLGNKVYCDLLGVQPGIALINEQAYSAGLIEHYLDAGYHAILMDWDNPSAHHPEWDKELQYSPQRARGPDGRDIGLLWTSTVAFQKLQRLAHGDISLEQYLSFISSQKGRTDRTLCVYASDTEIFDFRPGRYRTEETLGPGSEWERLSTALEAVRAIPGNALIAPSEAVEQSYGAKPACLRLETPTCPIPVKKQRKYNLTRWAVTGRDDLAINAACHRVYAALENRGTSAVDWKQLCYLWSSDFRTHITDARWKKYCTELAGAEARLMTATPPALVVWSGKSVSDRFIDVATRSVRARLDRRRGLAIQSLAFGPKGPCAGTLPHGYFDDIAVQADWYTGNCVYEQPGEPKITDLEWADTQVATDPESGDVQVSGTVNTPIGRVEKVIRLHSISARVDFDIALHWPSWGKGSLRLGHVTLLPEAFDEEALSFVTHNGGRTAETFSLAGQAVDHGAPVSFLVSASGGLGMTEGWIEIGDKRHGIRIEVERKIAPLLCMVTHKRIGGSFFCQLMLSALELDDTRKPMFYRSDDSPAIPRRFRFSLLGTNGHGRAC